VSDLEFRIIFPPWIGNHEADHHEAFPYLRGMATLALTEAGWEVEGSGHDWAHWVKGEKLIYVRGFGPPGDRRIPFRGQGGVTQEELDALADRLIEASGWELEQEI
jgi:hypothetical protein